MADDVWSLNATAGTAAISSASAIRGIASGQKVSHRSCRWFSAVSRLDSRFNPRNTCQPVSTDRNPGSQLSVSA